MKKIFVGLLAVASLAVAGVALAATTSQTAAMPTGTSTPMMMRTGGMGMGTMPGHVIGRSGTMGYPSAMRGFGGMRHYGSFGVLHAIAGAITIVLLWTIMVLLIIVLCKKVRRCNCANCVNKKPGMN